MIITIDGPVASGKSTVAQALARKLGFYYLNTGLLYRGLAYLLVTHESYTLEQLKNVVPDHLEKYLDTSRLMYIYDSGEAQILFDKKDITPFLKDAHISQGASIMSTNQHVRDALLYAQRSIADHNDVVVEGRDSGSVVFPEAAYKFFLTASLQERARRWQHMQEMRGSFFSIEEAMQELDQRDIRDKNRAIAPLLIPSGAIVIDSSNLNLDQVLLKMITFVKNER